MQQPEKFNLQNVISGRYNYPEKGWADQEFTLTDEQELKLLGLFTHRTRSETRHSLWRWVRTISSAQSYWAWERIVWEGDRWQYIAGQDYPAEIRQIRNWIKQRY